jgi:hypothetical protein
MPTLQTPELFTEILQDLTTPVPEDKLAYFRRRLRLHLHELVVGKFYAQETMTQRDLANRIGKTPDVVNRLLGAPGNWTLDTVSDLLIAMAAVPRLGVDNVRDMLVSPADEMQIAAMFKSHGRLPQDAPLSDAGKLLPMPTTAKVTKQGESNPVGLRAL